MNGNQQENGPKIEHHKINLPKGGGAIAGIGEKFQANAITGTGTMAVPLPLSPSRSGFEPKLSLTYDSGQGNSVFGLGWDIDLPAITRKTSKGLPQYLDDQESDVFLLSGAEDLVPIDSERRFYRPRIEGLFARIEKITTDDGFYWRATTRDNVTSIYGQSPDCRIADPKDASRAFKWLLEKTTDAKGNQVEYHYISENTVNAPDEVFEQNRNGADSPATITNKYIEKIQYGIKVNDPDEYHFTVYFDYQDHQTSVNEIGLQADQSLTWPSREDPFSDHRAGFERRTYRLCRRIVMFHDFPELGSKPVPVRELTLFHDENRVATKLTEVQQQGYIAKGNEEPDSKSFPAVKYKYSAATVDTTIQRIDAKSLENLPQGIGGNYQWVDLDGEGLSGILTEQGGAWYYKRNLGSGTFGPLVRLGKKPSPSQISGQPQLVDIDGDGNLELVLNTDQLSGFFSFADGQWESFQSFSKRLNIDFADPRIKQIDLTGDGRPDLLMAEDTVFTWNESLLKEGYAETRKVFHPRNEDQGPRVVSAEPVQTVFLADMTGDGLTDIVRIRNGEVCYWPNQGYGRFGAKVTMAGVKPFAPADQFNPRYIQLGDIDGSGTADIFYLAGTTARYWLNQSGNSLSDEHVLDQFPPVDSLSNVNVIDLMGTGTSCLVWSTQLQGKAALQMSYIDLHQEGKPHLLTQVDNQMGKQVNITYKPSTEDYLRDQKFEHPWITKLPFPVHVLREVETLDLIGNVKHHTLYRYHHGYFDGPEREFRGFGMVETIDTKDFDAYDADQANHYVKPVLTKTWFHNGAYLKQDAISTQYAKEYFGGIDADKPDVLPDTVIQDKPALNAQELCQAHRALKGRTLRQEVWEYDAENKEIVGDAPYTVAESNFTVHLIPVQQKNKHAVFRVDPRETITWHYEQNPADPRIAHDFILEVDDYGNVKKSCAVVYPRQGANHPTEQTRLYATYSENEFIDKDPWVGGPPPNFYMVGVPSEAKAYELGPLTKPNDRYLSVDDFGTELGQINIESAIQLRFDEALDYESSSIQKRLLSWQRFKYWNEAQDGIATDVTDKALLHHVESAVLTDELLDAAYGDGTPGSSAIDGTNLSNAGYVELDSNGLWWNPGLIQHYSEGDFYLPSRTEDPFGHSVSVTYDDYHIAPVETKDALDNTATAEIDYRTLSPTKLTDPNENVSEAITDPLGLVIATTVYGSEESPPDQPNKGDDPISSYTIVIPPNLRHVVDNPHTYLQNATTFFYYNLEAWSRDETNRQPPQAIGLSRETHVSEGGGNGSSRVQISLTYSDGFGREIQSKLLAEPGGAWVKNGEEFNWQDNVPERWLVSGRTVYNNKEKPVKQYEPFYSASSEYEPEQFFAEYGVTPTIHYDPLLRVIRTDTPKEERSDGAMLYLHSVVQFTPWEVKTHDANDALIGVPDLLELEEGTSYYLEHKSAIEGAIDAGSLSSLNDEQKALARTLTHAGTPGVALLDTLGRQYLTKQTITRPNSNRPWEVETTHEISTHTAFDITGKPLEVTDPRELLAFEYSYDMAGTTLRTKNIDAGDDRVLVNVMGNPVVSLDARGHQITAEYDELHRLVTKRVEGGAFTTARVVEQLTYGETATNPENNNLRGQLIEHKDQAGVTTVELYDIKGQPRKSQRQLRTEYKEEVDWAGAEALEDETFSSESIYDALGRVIEQHNPDGSVIKPQFHQSGRLNKMFAQLRGDDTDTPFVDSITYNAKSQREKITYGNNTETTYEYEPTTFRLTKLHTVRTSEPPAVFQDISYIYDPVGNIAKIRDDSSPNKQGVESLPEPEGQYLYDALYRLIEAKGREHLALNDNSVPYKDDSFKQSASLNDATQIRPYRRIYEYDESGNMTYLRHHSPHSTHKFTRQIDIDAGSNRGLLHDELYPNPDFSQHFDANGNQTKMEHLRNITWNYRDNIAGVTSIERTSGPTDDAEYYVYDASGQRTRKVKETLDNGIVKIEEKIYLGGVEIKRRREEGSLTNDEERWSLHVMDDQQRIALVHNWSAHTFSSGYAPALDTNHLRYQYGNHLGSASLELNGVGELISYEEYFPYGGTSFIAGQNRVEIGLKEYRYTGKERDDTTGLYYYGARYYAPWLGRWLSADPAGPVDGLNLYAYVESNPIVFNDHNGQQKGRAIRPDLWTKDLLLEFALEASVGGDVDPKETDPHKTYTPAEGGVGGAAGGGLRVLSLGAIPFEKNPTAYSAEAAEVVAEQTGPVGALQRLVTGETVTGKPASRSEAAVELVVGLGLIALGMSGRIKSRFGRAPKKNVPTMRSRDTANEKRIYTNRKAASQTSETTAEGDVQHEPNPFIGPRLPNGATSRSPYHGPWGDATSNIPPGGGTWGDFVERVGGGAAPSTGPTSHGHHIFLKRGRGEAGRAIAEEGQAILRDVGIDPILGSENLTHAPLHGTGIHTRATQMEILQGLRALRSRNAPRADYERLLQTFGERARNAPVNR